MSSAIDVNLLFLFRFNLLFTILSTVRTNVRLDVLIFNIILFTLYTFIYKKELDNAEFTQVPSVLVLMNTILKIPQAYKNKV